MECLRCKLQFLDPIPDKKSLDKIYKDYYQAWNIEQSEDQVSEMKKKTFRGYLKPITNLLASGRLLDIGCATGDLMEVAREDGFDVYGLEVSPEGIRRCKDKFGEDRIRGSHLKSGDFPREFFDVITLSDVFEHIPEPVVFLKNVYDILRPGGLLMISTPDTLSWTRRIMGRCWPHYKEEHPYYYNASNINRLLSSHFDILISRPAYKYLTLDYCCSVAKTYHNNRFIDGINRILQSFFNWLRLCGFKVNIGELFLLYRKKGQ